MVDPEKSIHQTITANEQLGKLLVHIIFSLPFLNSIQNYDSFMTDNQKLIKLINFAIVQ